MAFLAQLKGSLQGRKKYIDNVAETSTGTGEGISLTNSSGRTKFYSFNDFKDKSTTGYCGIKNQGATCYLNSLLQAFYMTPGFRQAVYKWRHDSNIHPPIENSPMYQLQKLFAEMQLSNKAAVSTLGLTKSFGWMDREAFQQQDVQEMKGAILQILETSSPELHHYVNSELTGEYTSYIDFVGTEFHRSQDEPFKDIILAIKGLSSVEEAIELYLKPELMNGDNQINCDELGGKVDSNKGIRFKTLPNTLTLQLQRFEMDWVRMSQVKLSDAVSIPSSMNMSKYMQQKVNKETKKQDSTNDEINDDINDDWYDLYAVAVHSGSAMGGHYFSYMHPPASLSSSSDHNENDKDWYNFNDATVTKLDPKTLKRVLGGVDVGKKGTKTTPMVNKQEDKDESKNSSLKNSPKLKLVKSSSNAYMLMYHRRSAHLQTTETEKTSNEENLISTLPPQMIQQIEATNVEYNLNKIEFNEKRDTYNLRIFQQQNAITKMTKASGYTTITINCNATMQELKQNIVAELNKTIEVNKITVKQIRLREYDTIRNLVTHIYSMEDKDTIKSLKLSKTHPIMCEYSADAIFSSGWNPETTISLCIKQECNGTMLPPVQLDVEKLTTIQELEGKLLKLTKWKAIRMILPTTRESEIPTILSTHTTEEQLKTMHDLGVIHGTAICVEEITPQESSDKAVIVNEDNSSILFQLGTLRATINIKFNVPLVLDKLNNKSDSEDSESKQIENIDTGIKRKEIVIDSRLPLSALKASISVALNLSQDQFVMKRTQSSTMWKDLNKSIELVGLRNKSSIHIEYGVQMTTTEYGLNLYHWNSTTQTLKSIRNTYVVDKTTTIKNVKLQLLNEKLISLNAKENTNSTSPMEYTRLRLRNCVEISNRVGKAWCNQMTVEENNGSKYLKDGMEVAVEVLEFPEELDEHSLLIGIRRWHPNVQVLDATEEIVMASTDTIATLKQTLSEMATAVAPTDISISKPFAWQMKTPAANLPHLQWDKLKDMCELKKDLRLEHGSVVVYKDNTIDEKVVTTEEKSASSGSGRNGGGGIKIYSFQEQLARAAEKKKKDVEAKKVEEEARADMETRRLNALGVVSEVKKTNCTNEKCKCKECTCGEGCTCGISMEVTCDPCKEFKIKNNQRKYPVGMERWYGIDFNAYKNNKEV